MSDTLSTTAAADGLTVKAHRGDRCVLLAFNIEEHLRAHLAGFAVRRRFRGGAWHWLMNRLSFSSDFTADTTAAQRKWFPTLEAPLQKFWWVDFPPEDAEGSYEYQVFAMRFAAPHSAVLTRGETVSVKLLCKPFVQGKFELAFTRGYLSSQAYTDRFHNAPIRPSPKTLDYDTAPLLTAYEWLGAHARATLMQFLSSCKTTVGATLDAMAYDLDEPDVVRALQALGPRLRIVLDNAALHTDAGALEPLALARLRTSAGAANVKAGRFGRYQHNKVFIMRVGGVAKRVLTGSTNFSVTGLYVNANHVAVFDAPDVAALYQQAFDAAFDGNLLTAAFVAAPVSKGEFEIARAGLPHAFISFAPHAKPTPSLDRLLRELNAADSSVLFAVMALVGDSGVLDTLRTIHATGRVFSYGITDNPGPQQDGAAPPPGQPPADGVVVFTPDKPGRLVESAALNKLVPPPFDKEFEMGLAHKVHHKFVVIDFNDTEPVVFFGSSNLATLGEQSNGDNLIAVYDRAVAAVFAIEAIRLVDHYAFRAAMQTATSAKPLRLRFDDEDWARAYYTPGSVKRRERLLFSR